MCEKQWQFQIDEALFQRIKAHLTRTGLTQKVFVIGLIEQALGEAEAELPEADEGGGPAAEEEAEAE